MNSQAIVDYAIKHTWLSISTTDALPYLNKRRNQITDTIKEKINKWYFWEEFTTNIIAWQREYTLPTSDYDTEWVQAVDRVEVKLSNTMEYRELINDQLLLWSYEEEWARNKNYPFYTVKDSSIILFPTPDESVTDWLVLYATTTLKDIEESTIESEIFGWHTELRQYIQLIADWLCIDLYARARQYDDKNIAQQDYDINIQRMIKAIGNRTKTISYEKMPDLSMYE